MAKKKSYKKKMEGRSRMAKLNAAIRLVNEEKARKNSKKR